MFAAIELDPELRRRLVRLQTDIGVQERGLRWLTPEQMHLTVKFLGEVPDDLIPAVCDALAGLAADGEPFAFEVRGVGCFPPRGSVRIVWAGLEEPSGRLRRFQAACEQVFAGLGFKQEHRLYAPHLTLARVKNASLSASLRAGAARNDGFSAGRQEADEVVLFESVLRREAARYRVVARCPFEGRSGDAGGPA
jgi:2'-5' RNA ligase